MNLKSLINTYPDFPKKGVQFKDVTPILSDSRAYSKVIFESVKFLSKWYPFDFIAGIESRGFWFACPIAHYISARFIPIRKPKKLPGHVISRTYTSEYKSDSLEMQLGNYAKCKFVIVDDILATGETALATIKLIESCRGVVAGLLFVGEISKLKGRKKLEGYNVQSLIKL